MRSVSDREFECKLELTPQQLQRVGINPVLEHLTVGKPVTRTLHSIYYDTPDHRLRAQGISLRVRSIGDQWVQTIQSGRTGTRNGASHPGDLELIIANAEPDISQIADSKVRRVKKKGCEQLDPGGAIRDGGHAYNPQTALGQGGSRARP
jgi:inorganic triphosphatase YgiF